MPTIHEKSRQTDSRQQILSDCSSDRPEGTGELSPIKPETVSTLLVIIAVITAAALLACNIFAANGHDINIQTPLTVILLLEVLGIAIFNAKSYNKILHENEEARERLSHQASHDALTGLFNRGAYDLLMKSTDTDHIALLLIDIDHFKEVNDTYGHRVGDRILKRVAEILRASFRSVDIICRIGGDEFAVVMTRANSSMSQLVRDKINRVNDLLQHPEDDLPPVSVSVGVAFSDRKEPVGDILADADSALYKVKRSGRNGCEIIS